MSEPFYCTLKNIQLDFYIETSESSSCCFVVCHNRHIKMHKLLSFLNDSFRSVDVNNFDVQK